MVKVVDPPMPVVVVVSVVPVVNCCEVIPVVVVVNHGVAVTVAGLDEEEELPAAGGRTKL